MRCNPCVVDERQSDEPFGPRPRQCQIIGQEDRETRKGNEHRKNDERPGCAATASASAQRQPQRAQRDLIERCESEEDRQHSPIGKSSRRRHSAQRSGHPPDASPPPPPQPLRQPGSPSLQRQPHRKTSGRCCVHRFTAKAQPRHLRHQFHCNIIPPTPHWRYRYRMLLIAVC